MAMWRCTSWVYLLLLKVREALTWMRCLGDRCLGETQSRSQNPAQSEINVATIVQNTGDIEAGEVRVGGVETGAPKENTFPFSELVALLQVAVVAGIGAVGMVSWTLLSCEKWWVPTLLFSSVMVAVAALAAWIVNEHLISNFKV